MKVYPRDTPPPFSSLLTLSSRSLSSLGPRSYQISKLTPLFRCPKQGHHDATTQKQ